MNPAEDQYITLRKKSTGTFNDRKSRFIGIAFPISTENEIKDLLTEVKKEYHDAVHHCYAWELFDGNRRHRHNDDGEPSGSAGIPIYHQILSHKLSNILIVVVRYYGGIKLGVPGLINAYRTAAAEAISRAETIEKFIEREISATFPYHHMAEISRIEKQFVLQRTGETYNDSQCTISWKIRSSGADQCLSRLRSVHGVQTQPPDSL